MAGIIVISKNEGVFWDVINFLRSTKHQFHVLSYQNAFVDCNSKPDKRKLLLWEMLEYFRLAWGKHNLISLVYPWPELAEVLKLHAGEHFVGDLMVVNIINSMNVIEFNKIHATPHTYNLSKSQNLNVDFRNIVSKYIEKGD